MAKLSTNRSILENVAVLYFFFFAALISLVYFAGMEDLDTVIVFALSGFVTSFFSKNMTVILVIMLVVSHVYKYGMQQMRVPVVMEGIDNMDAGNTEKILGDLREIIDKNKNAGMSKIDAFKNVLYTLKSKFNNSINDGTKTIGKIIGELNKQNAFEKISQKYGMTKDNIVSSLSQSVENINKNDKMAEQSSKIFDEMGIDIKKINNAI